MRAAAPVMNFFSSTPFLETLADCFFPGRDARIELCRVGGAAYRMLVVDGRPIRSFSFLDLLEPMAEAPRDIRLRSVGFLPRVALGERSVAAWQAAPDPTLDICPIVDWREVRDWESYEAEGGRCGRSAESRRRKRQLERAIGPLEMAVDTDDEAALNACLLWKSLRYRETGQPDVFADPRYARFYAGLLRRGLLRLTVLRGRDGIVAVHGCVLDGRRRRVWLQGYEPTLHATSPGRVLQEMLLEHSFRAEEREFDMLLGAEPYKFRYATHVRLCGPVGREPLAAHALRVLRPGIRAALRQLPWAQAPLRRLRQALADR